jgi:hypothetical protein
VQMGVEEPGKNVAAPRVDSAPCLHSFPEPYHRRDGSPLDGQPALDEAARLDYARSLDEQVGGHGQTVLVRISP